jgi:3-oxoacyl-[acyl-carrier-protein] synthase-3
MSKPKTVSIHGVGIHLPDEIRTNDWWPEEVVATWQQKFERRLNTDATSEPERDSERSIREAMAQLGADPFRGAVERRVLPANMNTSDMEIAAAREALNRAECSPNEIDLLLVSALIPDYVATNNACTVQHALGIPTHCFASTMDVACNAFNQQLAVAEAMVTSGRATKALLVQSCTLSRVLPHEEPHSPWFGDGASAVVVGEAQPGGGILGRAHLCNGSLQGSLVAGIPGKHWYDEGTSIVYSADLEAARAMFKGTVAVAEESISAALEDAGCRPDDVDYYACHQGFPWLRRVTQERAGLHRAKAVDSFAVAANVSAVNVPLVLALGEREGLLRDGDVVVTHSGGSGISYSSVVFRWGR